MSGCKHIFIINPAAGKSDQTAPVAGIAGDILRHKKQDYEILITQAPRHATKLVAEAAARNPGTELRFYACGGDGTLNEVAAGVASLPNAAVAHFPTGSGNDFIKLFHSDMQQFFNLERLLDGDIIELDYIRSDCGIATNVLSVGVDARIAEGMQKYKRLPLLSGSSAYLVSTAENLIRGLHQPFGVEIDGKAYDGRYTLILAANGRYYGGGFNPVPEADPTDGMLDILLVRDVSRLTAARVIGAYKEGKHDELPDYIKHLRAREMTVYSLNGKDIAVNLDGEIARESRVSLRVEEHGLKFIVPKGVKLTPPLKKQFSATV